MHLKNIHPAYARLLLAFACLLLFGTAFSQTKKGDTKNRNEIHIRNLDDTLIPSLVNKVEAYTFTIDRNNFILKKGFNLQPIEDFLPGIEQKLKSFKQRFEQTGSKMNLRSLNSAVILLGEVLDNLNSYKNLLTGYSAELTKSNNDVQKILADPQLKIEVPDSTLSEQVDDVLEEGRQLDTLQKRTLATINLLRSRVSVSILQAKDISSDMVYLSISKEISMWSKEEAPLLAARPGQYQQSFITAIGNALQRSGRIINIYLAGKTKVITICLLIFVLITFWCWSNMRRVKRDPNAAGILIQVNFLKRGVLVGCLMGFFTYAPLFFANPTMSLLHAIELFRLICLCFLLPPFLTKPAKKLWALLAVLWVYFALDDVLLESTFGERWGLFIAGIALVVLCLKMIFSKERFFVKIEDSPATKALVIFTLAQVVLSLIFNLTGRLSLAKIFGTSAIQCLMLGISLKVFCTMVLEAIYLQTEAYHESRLSAFINFKELQHRFQRNLWVLASIVWLIGLVRNLTLYDWVMMLAASFFNENRSIGSYSFTFASVAIFFCIIWLSSLISRFISFFFDNEKAVAGGKRSSLNSMMLIVRLAIWAIGFLIAVAAAGIPIDRLSIMLGALGVGIGFGLQNIVNNLVSGVILAFERPIQVGDQIEIGGKSGTVKEIGVRSSKLHNAEGADIIIPNGDLLSQQLINWTMQDRSKRVEFTISVPYETDMAMAQQLIIDQLKACEGISQVPEPTTVVQDFGEYGVSIKALFWVADLSNAGTMRTRAMVLTKNALAAAGIRLQIRPLA